MDFYQKQIKLMDKWRSNNVLINLLQPQQRQCLNVFFNSSSPPPPCSSLLNSHAPSNKSPSLLHKFRFYLVHHRRNFRCSSRHSQFTPPPPQISTMVPLSLTPKILKTLILALAWWSFQVMRREIEIEALLVKEIKILLKESKLRSSKDDELKSFYITPALRWISNLIEKLN